MCSEGCGGVEYILTRRERCCGGNGKLMVISGFVEVDSCVGQEVGSCIAGDWVVVGMSGCEVINPYIVL